MYISAPPPPMYNSNTPQPLTPTFSSAQLHQIIKKKPFSQIINGVQYTYSILCKKRQTFLFGNDRFLYINGVESISYARQLPQNQKLPFTHSAEIPMAKSTFPLNQIQHFTNEQQQFIIQFSGEKRVRWEFVCHSRVCALEWKRKLDQVMEIMNEFNLSGFERYDEFLRNRSAKQKERNQIIGSRVSSAFFSQTKAREYKQFSVSNSKIIEQNIQNQGRANLMAMPTQSHLHLKHTESNLTDRESFSPLPSIKIQNSPILQQNNQLQNFKLEELTEKQQPKKLEQLSNSRRLLSSKSQKKLKNLPIQQSKTSRPTAILFRGPTISKVDNFIIQSKQMSQQNAQMSSRFKINLKEDILKLKRDWIEELVQKNEYISLTMSFKGYIERVGKVIINQLNAPQQQKMFPQNKITKEFASYLIQNVEIQIYFYTEEHLIFKNARYRQAVEQFKNLDYLLGATNGESLLKVPLEMMFEYKGFLGMGRTRISSNGRCCNKQALEIINKAQFQRETKINANVLLDQNICRIVAYDSSSLKGGKTYFVQKLQHFLPAQLTNENKLNKIRPQLMFDEQLDNFIFIANQPHQVFNKILQQKIISLVAFLETEKEYFANSVQLSQLLHLCGLNISHIGAIYKKIKQNWLKKIIKSDIIARSLKNYYRCDIQNALKQQNSIQMYHRIQDQRLINFLNIVFGNNESTFRLWRNLNSYSMQHFDVKIWENQFEDINIGYLLQALQNHLKIKLSHDIHNRKFFKTMEVFKLEDIIRFQFKSTIYNLDFTQIFQGIHQCLQDLTFDSFHKICELLTRQTNKITYFEILKTHDLMEQVSQFLLEFTSPLDNSELYRRVEEKILPSRLTYETKLAELRWYMKLGKQENLSLIISFIQDHVKLWFGDVHPIFTHLNRLLAEYYSNFQLYYAKSIKYALSSLDMQLALFSGVCEELWKDHFLVGKIHYLNKNMQEALKYLVKGKQLVVIERLPDYQIYGEMILMLSRCYFGLRFFKESYMNARQLYKIIRQERDEISLGYIVDSVLLMKQLLQVNQEHESYEKFVETDFSHIVGSLINYPVLMSSSIKMIVIPTLKSTLLKNSNNRVNLLKIIDQISKIAQSSSSCLTYLKAKMAEGSFPKNYIQCLKDVDSVIKQIQENQMIERWKGFNQMANNAILDRISGSINRGFEFLAILTALFNLLGPEVLGELFIMEK